jgi:hypothetical protein
MLFHGHFLHQYRKTKQLPQSWADFYHGSYLDVFPVR